jgi:hypothetical protein
VAFVSYRTVFLGQTLKSKQDEIDFLAFFLLSLFSRIKTRILSLRTLGKQKKGEENCGNRTNHTHTHNRKSLIKTNIIEEEKLGVEREKAS